MSATGHDEQLLGGDGLAGTSRRSSAYNSGAHTPEVLSEPFVELGGDAETSREGGGGTYMDRGTTFGSSEGFGSSRSYPGTRPGQHARTLTGTRATTPESSMPSSSPSSNGFQPTESSSNSSRSNGKHANISSHRIVPSLSSGVPPALSKIKPRSVYPAATKGAMWDSPAAWMVYYFLANLSLTLYNKLLMNKFPFPWALTGIHTLCGVIGAQICLQQGFFTQQTLTTRENLVLVAFSSLYTINIAVSNLSLNLVTVPFHQVVRAMTPLFTIMLGVLMLKKRTSRATLISLIPVVLGVVFATYGDYYFTTWGLILTLIGTVLAAMKTIVTNMILVGRLKLHPLDLLLRMTPLAFMQCVFASWYTGELARVREYGATQMDWPRIMGLVTNGAIAFFLNVVSFTANKKTSALSMTVAANVKQVLTIILAVIIFHLHITPMNLFGISLTLFGGAAYAKVELDAKKAREQAVAPTSPLVSVVEEKRSQGATNK